MTTFFGVEFMGQHPDWNVVDDHHLERKGEFPDFATALDFVNRVGGICESMNHHAEFELGWGSVVIRTWRQDIDGLSERDWDLVNKIDQLE